MILLLGSMAFMQATFSLPGLAGLALTIGMAVDANVLVFERMREEKERGASLAQQIRNGFNRAWVTIFDSHVTNFLAALVLYIVGTEQVKGFALTMIIGMAWNLFTAVFMSRVIFEVCYTERLAEEDHDAEDARQDQYRFHRPPVLLHGRFDDLDRAGPVRDVLSAGQGMFNIDFTGGTLVTIRLNENDPAVKPLSGSERAELVRRKAKDLPDVTVESLRMGNDQKVARFNIRTTDPDLSHVKNEILSAFGSSLARVEMSWNDGIAIPGAPAAAAAGTTKTAAGPKTRFPGGREYELTFNTTAFNSTETPAQVVSAGVCPGSRRSQDRQPHRTLRDRQRRRPANDRRRRRRPGRQVHFANRSRA